MQLRGIEFGNIWAAAGALGFFGEGYWFHRITGLLDTTGMTFVGKTVPLPPIIGNMPLNETTWQPKERFPKCIKFDFLRGNAINAVGLSSFGLKPALATGNWQKRTEPFMNSWMPVGKTPQARLLEANEFTEVYGETLSDFKAPVALQVNLSCPNTGEDLQELIKEAVSILKILGHLNIPLIPKFNILTEPKTVASIADNAPVDAFCISNTVPYGQLPNEIDWSNTFGETSPLAALGGGGLSGNAIFNPVFDWFMRAQEVPLSVPLNWCGGIMTRSAAEIALTQADSISLGTVCMLRPWRVQSLIRAAQL